MLLDETESLCPECLEKIPARRVVEMGDVYFEKNPEELLKCMLKEKVVDVNKKALEVYKVIRKEEILTLLNQQTYEKLEMVPEDFLLDNKKEILALIEGKSMLHHSWYNDGKTTLGIEYELISIIKCHGNSGSLCLEHLWRRIL